MEFWLRQRRLEVVAPEDITIANFVIPQDANTGERTQELSAGYRATPPIDANVPFVLCRFFKDTVSLRVLQMPNKKQCFLFVRDNLSTTFPKKEVVDDLCVTFLPLAPCMIFAGRISVLALQAIRLLAKTHGNQADIMSISDVMFDKMSATSVPEYRVLNIDEIHDIEARKKLKATDFPRILACEPVVLYCGFHIGQVLEKRDKRTGAMSYRIVASASGLLPQSKD